MDDEPMESDPFLSSPESNRGGLPVFVPVALAIIGIALGGVALAMTMSAGNEEELNQRLAASGDQVAKLEQRLSELNAQNEKLRHDVQSLEQQVRSITGQTQTALNQVRDAIIATREQITTNAASIKEVVETLNRGPAQPAPTVTVTTTGSTDSSETVTVETQTGSSFVPGGIRSHVIAEGETFSSVANRYGVPLSKVLDANPDVDPRRLRVGQEIKIPHHRP